MRTLPSRFTSAVTVPNEVSEGYLFQKVDDEERVISYFSSRATTKEERKWDTRELEVLAMIATLGYFRHYTDGGPVYLDSDHKNITWLSKL